MKTQFDLRYLLCAVALASLAACGGGGSGGPTPDPPQPPAAVNTAPRASAGSEQWVQMGSSVTLNGSASSDPQGDQLSYAWRVKRSTASAAPRLAQSNAATSAVQFDESGVYEFELTVTDPGGLTSSDSVIVAVATPFVPPANVVKSPMGTARLPANDKLGPGEAITVDMALSTIPSASSTGVGTFTYFNIISAPAGSQAKTTARADGYSGTFTPDKEGVYVVDLLLKSTNGAEAHAQQWFAVMTGFNNRPIARGTPGAVYVATNTASVIDASTSYDPNGDQLRYTWALVAKPADSKATLVAAPATGTGSPNAFKSVTPDIPGMYYVTLTVDDGRGTTRSSASTSFLVIGNPVRDRRVYSPSPAFDSFTYAVAASDPLSSDQIDIFGHLLGTYDRSRINERDMLVMKSGLFNGTSVVPFPGCPSSEISRGCRADTVSFRTVTPNGALLGMYANADDVYTGFVVPSLGSNVSSRFTIGKFTETSGSTTVAVDTPSRVGPIQLAGNSIAFVKRSSTGYNVVAGLAGAEPTPLSTAFTQNGALFIGDGGTKVGGYVLTGLGNDYITTKGLQATLSNGILSNVSIIDGPDGSARSYFTGIDTFTGGMSGCSSKSDPQLETFRPWVYRFGLYNDVPPVDGRDSEPACATDINYWGMTVGYSVYKWPTQDKSPPDAPRQGYRTAATLYDGTRTIDLNWITDHPNDRVELCYASSISKSLSIAATLCSYSESARQVYGTAVLVPTVKGRGEVRFFTVQPDGSYSVVVDSLSKPGMLVTLRGPASLLKTSATGKRITYTGRVTGDLAYVDVKTATIE